MSSLFCFMHFMWRYHGSKGVPEWIVEDGVLGNLAPPGDLEESASHHIWHQRRTVIGAKHYPIACAIETNLEDLT